MQAEKRHRLITKMVNRAAFLYVRNQPPSRLYSMSDTVNSLRTPFTNDGISTEGSKQLGLSSHLKSFPLDPLRWLIVVDLSLPLSSVLTFYRNWFQNPSLEDCPIEDDSPVQFKPVLDLISIEGTLVKVKFELNFTFLSFLCCSSTEKNPNVTFSLSFKMKVSQQ